MHPIRHLRQLASFAKAGWRPIVRKYSALKAAIWEVRSWNGGMPGPPGFPSNNEENASTAPSAPGYRMADASEARFIGLDARDHLFEQIVARLVCQRRETHKLCAIERPRVEGRILRRIPRQSPAS